MGLPKYLYGVSAAAALVGVGVAVGTSLQRRGRALPTLERGPALAPTRTRSSRLVVIAPPYGRITLTETEAVLSWMHRAPPGPFGMIIHALGGFSTAVDHLARAMRMYEHPITAYVPYRAMSGGTLLALAADRIQMNATAILGPVDPQLAGFPAHSIATLLEKKPIERMSEEWYVLALESRKAIDETTRLVRELVASPTAVSRLTNGDTTHGLGIGLSEAQEIGLPVYEGITPEIMALADQAIAASKLQEFPFPGR